MPTSVQVIIQTQAALLIFMSSAIKMMTDELNIFQVQFTRSLSQTTSGQTIAKQSPSGTSLCTTHVATNPTQEQTSAVYSRNKARDHSFFLPGFTQPASACPALLQVLQAPPKKVLCSRFSILRCLIIQSCTILVFPSSTKLSQHSSTWLLWRRKSPVNPWNVPWFHFLILLLVASSFALFDEQLSEGKDSPSGI